MPHRDAWNGELEGYHVRYSDLHHESSTWKNISVNSYATLIQEINDLVFQHIYMFQMQSHNLLGASNWSAPSFVFMEVGMRLDIHQLWQLQLLTNLVSHGQSVLALISVV